MIRYVLAVATFMCFTILCQAQSYSGFWRGKIVMGPGSCFPVYNIELQITDSAGKISGSAYHFSDANNYVRQGFTGEYKKDSGLVVIQETGVITFKVSDPLCVPCVKSYRLTFHRSDATNEEELRGRWTGISTDKKTVCNPGTIILQRYSQSAFEPEKPKEIPVRKNSLSNTIYVDTGMVKLDFYDNGVIDGDIITVLINNQTALSKKLLSTTAITTNIHISPEQPEHNIIMIAENLGSIPPNTALVIITTGNKRHQIHLSSDEKQNAMFKIIYDKIKTSP